MIPFLTSPISFPGLGIEINPSDGFTIGNFTIKWYGVIIAVGVLLATLYILRRVKQFGLTEDDILNMLIIGLPSAIVCARLYYVVFEWKQFFGPGIPWYKFLDPQRRPCHLRRCHRRGVGRVHLHAREKADGVALP